VTPFEQVWIISEALGGSSRYAEATPMEARQKLAAPAPAMNMLLDA
jgi:hypothetical protein